MSAAIAYSYYPHDLPWTIQKETQERFRKLLRWSLASVLFLSLLFSFLPLPEPEEPEKEDPKQLVKLIPKVEIPPPPPPKVKPIETKVKPKPKQKVKPKPKPKKEPIKTAKKPKKAPVKTKSAKEIAASSGLLAMKDDLADLKNDSSVKTLGERSLNRSGSEGKAVKRSLVTKNYGKASGGINTASLSKDTGGNGLGGRSAGQVGGVPGLGGAGGTGSGGGAGSGNGDGTGYGKTRDLEKIQITFDRNKSGLFTMYNRELRKDASLQGKVVLNLTIAPSGKVTHCSIVSSELGNSQLENKLVQRVKLINFGAEDVPPFTFNYPIDFYPV